MRMLDLVPVELKQYIKLLRLKQRYPTCNIQSPLVSDKAVLGVRCSILRDVEIAASVSVGDYSYINAGTIVASGTIGKFCAVGYHCQIGMPTHPTDFISVSPRIYGQRNVLQVAPFWNDYPSPPVIGNDVWIASHALILQGVSIGDGSIVAAGAVVAHDVPPYTIVAGVPAKPIRKRFSESVIEALMEWNWWNLDLEELRELASFFSLGRNAVDELPAVLEPKQRFPIAPK